MAKKTSYIDFENRIIVGKSGLVYDIAPEKVASKLWAEYQIRGALLGFNLSLESFASRLNESIDHLRNGKQNAQGNASNSIVVQESILEGLLRYKENNENGVLEFLSIFCKSKNEPVDSNDESIIRRKFDDWGEIPQTDLFFLSQLSIVSYKENLKKQLEIQRQKESMVTNPS